MSEEKQFKKRKDENLIQDEVCRCNHSIDDHEGLNLGSNPSACKYCVCQKYVWKEIVIKSIPMKLIKCERCWRVK